MDELETEYRPYEAKEIKRSVYTDVAIKLLPHDINLSDMKDFLNKVEKVSACIIINSMKFAQRKTYNE